MYLSKLLLPLGSREVQLLLHDPYLMHQALLLGFPDRKQGGQGRLLFRLEPEHHENKGVLLVQSEVEPCWGKAQFAEVLPVQSAECKSLAVKLSAGGTLRFRLRANPTLKRENKRLPIVGEESQRKWLTRKFSDGGFALLGAVLIDEGKVTGRKKGALPDFKPNTMTFLSLRCDGVVRVVDPKRALETLQKGIGPAKAFGFGLLSLARS